MLPPMTAYPARKYKAILIMLFISYFILGIVTGTLAGLLGIGGGLIVVPTLALLFSVQGFNDSITTHLAIGTSLACMICTATSSVLTHNKKGSVNWRIFLWMAIGLIFGSWAGGLITANLNGRLLKILLAIFVWVMAWRMWRKGRPVKPGITLPKMSVFTFFGTLFGCISTMFGIGGGFMTVPLLSRLGLPMQSAVGTASACSLPIAVIGAMTSMFTGHQVVGIPNYATGYVYWPAFAGIVIGSMPCARIGAKLAHVLPAARLRKIFAIFLIIIGCELIAEE